MREVKELLRVAKSLVGSIEEIEDFDRRYKEKKRQEKSNAPREVKQVYREMLKNAKEAGMGRNAVYFSLHLPDNYDGANYYIIGSNYEDGSSSMVYNLDDRKWYYRNRRSGGDKPMRGGYREALSNAEIFFTG